MTTKDLVKLLNLMSIGMTVFGVIATFIFTDSIKTKIRNSNMINNSMATAVATLNTVLIIMTIKKWSHYD